MMPATAREEMLGKVRAALKVHAGAILSPLQDRNDRIQEVKDHNRNVQSAAAMQLDDERIGFGALRVIAGRRIDGEIDGRGHVL